MANDTAAKKPNVFKRFGKFCKEVSAEVKQLTWPTKKELLNYCLAVVAFCALMALIIGLLDLGFMKGFEALGSLGN